MKNKFTHEFKEIWENIAKLFGKQKSTHIKSITKVNGKSTTSTIKIANELAGQFARTSPNKNYIKVSE
jgi:hypothetical protein